MRILSVAPRYRTGVGGAEAGHYTVYQDDLREAGTRLGMPVVTLADRSVLSADGVLGALDVTSPQAIAQSVGAIAQLGDHVMVYEGSLATVAAFIPLAHARPDLRIVVNLFRPEPGLVPTMRPTGRTATASAPGRATSAGLPSNLVVSAETEFRVELARRMGVRCAGAWRLHSTLWDVAVDARPRSSAATSTERAGRRLRVLVPLADRGYGEDVVQDLATVLRLLRSHPDGERVSLTLTGAGSTRLSARVRGPRLERLGARRIDGPADREEYAALFASHDVIWIPNRASYRSQSSGKALDALVVGRPVVGFEGGWPASEASRWLGETLDYRDVEGAVRLLLDLQRRVQELQGSLAAQATRIRAAYAPESTLLRVLELLAPEDAEDGRHAQPPYSPPPIPALADPKDRDGRSGSDSQPPLAGRLAARIAGLRAAFIGPGPRIERRIRRRLPAVRTRLRNLRAHRSGH